MAAAPLDERQSADTLVTGRGASGAQGPNLRSSSGPSTRTLPPKVRWARRLFRKAAYVRQPSGRSLGHSEINCTCDSDFGTPTRDRFDRRPRRIEEQAAVFSFDLGASGYAARASARGPLNFFLKFLMSAKPLPN
jgi:hypothetical protein